MRSSFPSFSSSSRSISKAITLLLASCILLQTPSYAARYIDTAGSWTEKYVNRLSDKGVIPAAADGKFNPDQPVTRAQLAAWLVKVLGIDEQPVPETSSFPDVKTTDWFFKPVEIIRQNNYLSGYADGFRPNQFIQRAEVLTILARTLNVAEPSADKISAEIGKYTDGSKVPEWAKVGVAEASAAGIVVDDKNPQQLNPTSLATRGETAALLSKLDEYKIHKDLESAINQPPPQAPPPSQSAAQAPPASAPPPATAPGAYSQQQYSAQVEKNAFATQPAQAPLTQPPVQAQQPPPPPPAQQPPPPQTAYVGGYPPPGYGAGQPQYAPTGGYPPPNYLQGGVATVAAGTKFRASLTNTLDSGSSQPGEQVQATLGAPLYANGAEVVPAGSRLIGTVSNVQSAKRFHAGENGKIDIRFTAIETPDGRKFPLQASVDGTQIHLSGGTTAGRVGKGLATAGVGAGGGAALGTALGAIVGATSGGGHVGKATAMGAIFGTAIGGGVGAVGGVVRKGSEVKFPAGMSLPVQLDGQLQVTAPQPSYPPPGYGGYGGGYGYAPPPPPYYPQQ